MPAQRLVAEKFLRAIRTCSCLCADCSVDRRASAMSLTPLEQRQAENKCTQADQSRRGQVKFKAKGHEIEKCSGSAQTGTGNLEEEKRPETVCDGRTAN